METKAGAGLEPVQESCVQKTEDCLDTSQDTHWRELVQLTDVPRTYTFTELSVLLEVNESTLRKRWWEKLEAAYQHCPEVLRVEVRTTKAGSPVFAFTEFGLQAFREFKAANEEGCGDRYLQAVSLQYPPSIDPVPAPGSNPPVTVEVGNHQIVLSQPELPQTYSLESLRQSEVIAFDDPLAIAAQFLQTADALTAEMQRDIRVREQKLQQTQQAKTAIAEKATEFKLEARLYRERTEMLATAQSQETQSLQQSLTTLQNLGKPPADA
ncbi:MAG: hypothetical protein KME45_19810 [Stenomitos rutilans HA7619-LM2]|jgi:hypothetical protein|nr:hypothetical protein [Stenomitos rutilans HA7619-LM2]